MITFLKTIFMRVEKRLSPHTFQSSMNENVYRYYEQDENNSAIVIHINLHRPSALRNRQHLRQTIRYALLIVALMVLGGLVYLVSILCSIKENSSMNDPSTLLLLNPERVLSVRRWDVHITDTERIAQASKKIPPRQHVHLHLRDIDARLQTIEMLARTGTAHSVPLTDTTNYVAPLVHKYRDGNAAAARSIGDDDGRTFLRITEALLDSIQKTRETQHPKRSNSTD